MRKPVSILFVVLAIMLAVYAPVSAITFGEPDGNDHPYVGAMIVEEDGEYFHYCSGTLIAPDVFLTASHCTVGLDNDPDTEVYVTFDPVLGDLPDDVTLYHGETVTHPLFASGGMNNTYDIAVILLDEPVVGITPAQLPEEGLLDELAAKGGLVEQRFTSVGYGTNREDETGGPHSLFYLGERWQSNGEFLALNKYWLRLSQNPSSGSGGTCYGDSGGPNFLGDTNIVVGITVTGDVFCRATNTTYRTDTDVAQEFLSQFVTLP